MEELFLHWPNSVHKQILDFITRLTSTSVTNTSVEKENTLHVLARSLTLHLVEIYIKLEIFLENAT